MASIRKYGDKWRAEVWRNGKRSSKVMRTKREAQDWAARQEYLVETGVAGLRPSLTISDLVDRYEKEILPKKATKWNSKGGEASILKAIREDEISVIPLSAVKASDLSGWRDRLSLRMADSSVQRYMSTLSAMLSVAERDWELIPTNPMRRVRRPPAARPRDRRPTASEIDRLSVAGGDIRSAAGRAHQAFLFAIETAMRAGEISRLSWADIDLDNRVAHLDRTKNGDKRDVPLSSEAIRIVRQFDGIDPPFGFTSGENLSANWYFLKTKALVEDLHFHDSRHEAITRLSRKLDVLALARMVGHKNLKQLMVYYNETAAELAKRLD